MLGKFLVGNPYVLLGIAGAFLLLAVGNVTFFALWRGAEKGEAAARLESNLHQADADRWRKASDQRDLAIVGLNDRIDHQNAAMDRLSAAKAGAERFAAEAATEATNAQQAITELTLKTQERIHAHPEDARPLGPAACDVYRALYGSGVACTK